MDKPGLTASLTESFEQLPQQLQAVARWVLDHPADVALLTTREQAKPRRPGSGEFHAAGAAASACKGYDALRAVHAAALAAAAGRLSAAAPANCCERHGEEGPGAIAQDMFAALAEHLKALREPQALARFEQAADLLSEAQTVFCFGLRSAFPAAFMLDYIRDLIGAGSVLADGAGGRGIDALRRIGPGDALFAVSVAPYTRQTVQAAEIARESGAKVVALTDSALSPLAAIADVALLVRTETPSFFHTMTPAFAAVECLAALMTARKGKPALDAIARHEAALDAVGTFLNPRSSRRGHR
jgi:DNA-binding MurR/RpiR family transcriptional regulator